MLQKLGELLQTHTRRGDVVCRYGGEEFVLIMPRAPLEDAAHRAEDLRVSFENMGIQYGSAVLRSTLSLGVATFPLHGKSGEAILDLADTMLYAAKGSGRNRVLIAPVEKTV